MKRLFDVVVAAGILVVTVPLLLCIMLAIWIDDPGPVMYRGLRVGRDGVPFYILKFRTMKRNPSLRSNITLGNDPRVTRVGRFLRAAKLDELPQVMNVLRGEMSLVGPRPEAPYYVKTYLSEHREVLRVRPGITGAAQIHFRHEEQMLSGDDPEGYYRCVILPTKLALDQDYVRRQSWWLDLTIIARTLLALVRSDPAPGATDASAGVRGALEVSATGTTLALPALGKGGPMMEKGFTSHSAVAETTAPASPKGWATIERWVQYHTLRRIRSYGLAVLLDALTVTAAFEVAMLLRFVDTGQWANQLQRFWWLSLVIGCLYAAISYLLGLHRRIWRYASIKDVLALAQSVGLTVLLITMLGLLKVPALAALPWSVTIGGALFAFLFLAWVKFSQRVMLAWRATPAPNLAARVLIVGAGQAGAELATRFLKAPHEYHLSAFIDDDPAKWHRRIQNRPIFGPLENIPTLVKQHGIDLIAIAMPTASARRISEIINLCQQTPARIKILPGLPELLDDRARALPLREVNVADLLGREVVPFQTIEARLALAGKVILVTGAAGSIGSELCRQLIAYQPARLIALDNNETGLFDLAESLRDHPDIPRLRLRIGDITNIADMTDLFADEQPDIIFHAAAYKHVPLLETHAEQAIRTNVLGTYHLCHLAHIYKVGCFVFISSDKAAEPINVLGASKRLGELIIQAMAREGNGTTRFCGVRFGNVIGSRGSVVPIFTKQIEQGGPVTVTSPETTRYFMTIPEACGLVILTATLAGSGGLFLLDMGNPVRIADLAVKMIRSYGLRVERDIRIVYTGLRPGERLHELLAAPGEELLPTSQDKIFRLASAGEAPSLATIEQWIDTLQQRLEQDDRETLRAYLLSLTTQQPPAQSASLVPAHQTQPALPAIRPTHSLAKHEGNAARKREEAFSDR